MTPEAAAQQETGSERRLPVPVAVLLVAAIVDAWLIASRQLEINSFPSDMPRLVVHVAQDASDFLIAAALMGAPRRWFGDRRWFVAGAALFALHGILALAQAEWLASITLGNLATEEIQALQAQLSALALAIALVGLVAPLVVVVALWQARPGPIRVGGLRSWLIAVTAIVGVLAMAAHLAYLGAWVPEPTFHLVPVITGFVDAGSTISLLLLALMALATMPRGGGVGNLLIAGGIGVALAANGWSQLFQSQGQLQNLPPQFFDLVFTVPAGAAVIGMLVMAGGVVVGRRPLA
jgi:hypothetical protein